MVTMNGEDGALAAAAPNLDNSLDDDDDDGMSDGSSPDFGDSNDLMAATMEDEVTAQLAASGPVGMAAAAAIASAKKRKRPHQFETNPSIRKRQQTRLLRKLRQTIDEFTIRVGMQAVVLVAIPGKPQNSYKCFGAKPLEDCIRNLRPVVMQDLENALAQHAPAPQPEDPSLHELPPLVIEGLPTAVEKMTQAQLRAFIPLMLKYSTGRGKPGWGKESTRPPWWPQDLPWANVRMDARTEDEKQKVSWTHALRQIVINCYKFHGREDLLPVFTADQETDSDMKPPLAKIPKASPSSSSPQQHQQQQQQQIQQLPYGLSSQVHQFQPTVLQTISNPDGTVSIIQVDPTNSIIQLPDGTTAQVQGVATLQHSADGTSSVTMTSDPDHHHDSSSLPVTVDLSQATIGQEGQIILTGEDGQAYPVTVSGMITVPVPPSMYQTVVANISSIQAQSQDGTLQTNYVVHQHSSKNRKRRFFKSDVVTPMVIPKVEPGNENESLQMTTLTAEQAHQLVTLNANGQTQILHNDKIYQLCEFMKPENQGGEKVIMMTEVTQHTHHQQQQEEQIESEEIQDQEQQQQCEETVEES